MDIFFSWWVGFSPYLHSFLQMVYLWEGIGQSIHGRGNKQDESRANIFVKMENTWGVIQAGNSARHCFVLKDSVPIKFFKQAMIMKLKICTTGKIFGNICLKAIGDNFSQYLVCNQERDEMKHEGMGEDSIFWWGDSDLSPVLSLVESPDLP